MGFGHRVYKNFDPRAKIIKAAADTRAHEARHQRPAARHRQAARGGGAQGRYFVERKLYPNVDFYSGIIYRALGIPDEHVHRDVRLGRLPGWIAHWKEMMEDPTTKIGRPRQIYTGPSLTHYVPIDQRQ